MRPLLYYYTRTTINKNYTKRLQGGPIILPQSTDYERSGP